MSASPFGVGAVKVDVCNHKPSNTGDEQCSGNATDMDEIGTPGGATSDRSHVCHPRRQGSDVEEPYDN